MAASEKNSDCTVILIIFFYVCVELEDKNNLRTYQNKREIRRIEERQEREGWGLVVVGGRRKGEVFEAMLVERRF